MKAYLQEILRLMNASHSPYHVVEESRKLLLENGYKELEEEKEFDLKPGEKYFVRRNGSSFIAFIMPTSFESLQFHIEASHTDSPTFKLKPSPVLEKGNVICLNVEPYGGMIMSTWMDRPLSIAGRVLVDTGKGVQSYLLDVKKDLLTIPNVCIHYNREVNKGYHFNPAIDMIPVMGIKHDGFDFNSFLLDELGLDKQTNTVLSHDLCLYLRQESRFIGVNDDFISSPKIDNLTSVYSSLLALIDTKPDANIIKLVACFDNEEVGSMTRQGAHSTFMKYVMKRIVKACKKDEFGRVVSASAMVSIDNGHAIHPNHPEYTDKTSVCELGKGIMLKFNYSQRYATDGMSASLVKYIAKRNDIPVQEYTNRSDLPGGSTLGNLTMSEVSLCSVDIGIPQLAMHSSTELASCLDIVSMARFCKAYFDSELLVHTDSIEFNE